MVYREDNTYVLADLGVLKQLGKKPMEALEVSYQYHYEITNALNKQQAKEEVIGDFTEANIDSKKLIPIINDALNTAHTSESCPLTDDINSWAMDYSMYRTSWVFSVEANNTCYYNLMVCSVDDSDTSCIIQIKPDEQTGIKVFEVSKQRSFKATKLVPNTKLRML